MKFLLYSVLFYSILPQHKTTPVALGHSSFYSPTNNKEGENTQLVPAHPDSPQIAVFQSPGNTSLPLDPPTRHTAPCEKGNKGCTNSILKNQISRLGFQEPLMEGMITTDPSSPIKGRTVCSRMDTSALSGKLSSRCSRLLPLCSLMLLINDRCKAEEAVPSPHHRLVTPCLHH